MPVDCFLLALIFLSNTVAAVEILSNPSSSSPVTAMFVLGDSSVDCGDNTLYFPLFRSNISLHPCNGSDSNLLPQLLAKKMGLPLAVGFYRQNGSIEEIQRGINFGSAEASIMNPNSRSYQSLNQQIRQALEILQLLQLMLGQEPAVRLIRSSIFYLSFGKDDYIDFFLRTRAGSKFNRLTYANILVDQMSIVLRNMYDSGIRKIICMGVLPLGCAPRMLWERTSPAASVNKKGCEDDINAMIFQYNALLEQHILELNRKLAGAQIVFCDVYRAMMELITNPNAYGFVDVQNACCGMGRYGSKTGCLSLDMACEKASTHVWWDFYNPSQAVNDLIASSAFSGWPLPGICRPVAIQVLASTSV